MNSFDLPEFEVGMKIITPATSLINFTADKYYTVLKIKDGFIEIEDDFGIINYQQSHMFIEADVYYGMIIWLSMVRLFELTTKHL